MADGGGSLRTAPAQGGSLACKGCWLGAQDAEWKEGDHPRAENGEFGSGGSSGREAKGKKTWPATMKAADLVKLAKGIHHTSEDFTKGNITKSIMSYGTYELRRVSLEGLDLDGVTIEEGRVANYAKMDGDAPPIIVGQWGIIIDGNHRANAALARGETDILAYVGEPKKFGKDSEIQGRWLGADNRWPAQDDGKWVEGDHPRGQPGNAGQFGSGGAPGGPSKTAKEKSDKPAEAGRQDAGDPKPSGAAQDPSSTPKEQAASAGGGSLKPKAEIDKGDHFIPPDKFNAADFAKAHDQAGVTPEDILANFPEDTADKIRASVDALAARKATAETFKRDGVYDEERAALHRKIVIEGVTKQVMDEKTGTLIDKHYPGLLSPERVKAATPPKGEAPTFTILGGRGGSGKSWFKGKVYDEDKAIVLDSDHIKGLLPEYEGWNAAQVHDESGELFDTVTAMAKEMGLNIVHDATMKSPDKAVSLVSGFKDKGFKDKGYKVEAHYMHLPRQEAAKRAVQRFLGKTKRLVPPQVILANTENEKAFEGVRKLADRWSFRDNSGNAGEPKLVSQSEN